MPKKRRASLRFTASVLSLTALLGSAALAGGASTAAAATCDKVAAPGSGSAQALANSLAAGQTGCLRGGTYSASGNVLIPSHGNFTLRSYPGERAKLTGIIQFGQGVNNVTLSGLDIEGTGAGGANTIKIYAADITIEDSNLTNNWRGRSCIMLGNISGGGTAVRPTIRRNTFHECGDPAQGNHDHSIYASNTTDGKITDNLFYNSAAYTIQLYPNAQRTQFARNIVDGGAPSIRGGLVFGGDNSHASSHNIVENNVIAYAATWNITSNWEGPTGTGNIARNNCVWGGNNGNINTPNGFTATNNTTTNPNFTNRKTRAFAVAASSRCAALVRARRTAGGPRGVPKIRVALRLRKYRSARVFNRRGLKISLRVGGGILRGARVQLRRRGRVYASRRLAALAGPGRVPVPKRRSLRRGRYQLVISGHNAIGQRVTRKALVRFRR